MSGTVKAAAMALAAKSVKGRRLLAPKAELSTNRRASRTQGGPSGSGSSMRRPKGKVTRVCVLNPSYKGIESPTAAYDGDACGPQQWVTKKSNYAFDVVDIEKADSYRKIRELVTSNKYDVFFNLCDGSKEESRAGVDVLLAMEEMNAAYTGADSRSFEPNKIEMKVLVGNAGVKTPNFVFLTDAQHLAKKCRHLKFPVIVKSVNGYASVGIQKDNRCENMDQLAAKLKTFLAQFDHALIEEFIRGREGTVLACRDPDSPHGVKVFRPLMLTYLSNADDFTHFDSKWKSSWEEWQKRVTFMSETDPAYQQVIDMARNSFYHVLNNVGYGRCDFRIDEKNQAYFLEINPNCGMWAPPNEGGDFADKMVKEDPKWNHDTFVEVAVKFALQQRRARTPWFVMSHDSRGNFATRASATVEEGTPLFGDCVHPIPVLAKALYQLGVEEQDVGCVVKRADGLHQVVPVRHSCEPNMTFVHGPTLTCEASRQISAGEELTIDYSSLRDMEMPKFACRCGTVTCRGVIISQPPVPRNVDRKLLRKLLLERKRQRRGEQKQIRQATLLKTANSSATPTSASATSPSSTPASVPASGQSAADAATLRKGDESTEALKKTS